MAPTLLAALDTGDRFKAPAHIQLLNEKLMALEAGDITRLAVFMPPRHGKSHLCSTYFPAWYLLRNPEKNIILASYGASIAERWGRRVRGIVSRCGPLFDVALAKNVSAAGAWETSRGGGMVAVGVGGAITGRGSDIAIVDDPVENAEQAMSETYREKAWDWYFSTLHTRLEPGGRVLLIQTRWHEDDLAGRVLKNTAHEGWDVLSLPALAERNDPLGRKEGEALWPERFNAEALRQKRDTPEGHYWWASMYQQRPAPAEGGVIQRRWFKYARQEDMAAGQWRRFTTVDLATSERTMADNTVMATWAYEPSQKKLVLIDLFADRVDSPTVIRMAHTIMQRHGIEAFWVEQVAYQLSMIQHMRAAGIPVRTIKPTKDKVSRAQTANPFWEAGQVYFLAGAHWLDELEHELLSFPNAKHDDRVDAVTYGILVAFRQALLGETKQLR